MKLPKPNGPFPVGFTDIQVGNGNVNFVARLYYPCLESKTADPGYGPWFPDPEYYKAYGYYMRMPEWMSSAMFWGLFRDIRIHAVEDAPPIKNGEARKKCILFSHGLGGIRTTYSTLCTMFASKGHLVAAIEHNDRSASMTKVNGNIVKYDHSMSTYEARNQQLIRRREEIILLKDVILEKVKDRAVLHSSVFKQLASPNTRFIAMGHSFGAATVFSLGDHVDAGVCLDPWTFPLGTIDQPFPKPALTVIMENFTWPENTENILKLMSRNGRENTITLPNADHMDVSDVSVVMPTLLKWVTASNRRAAKVQPEETIKAVSEMIESFIESVEAAD